MSKFGPLFAVFLASFAFSQCKARQAESSAKSFEEPTGSDTNSKESLLSSLEQETASVARQGEAAPAKKMGLDGDSPQDVLMQSAAKLEGLSDSKIQTDVESVRKIANDLKALSKLVDGLTPEDSARIAKILKHVDVILAAGKAVDDPPARTPTASATPDTPDRRVVDGYTLECAVHPDGVGNMNWSLKVNGNYLVHANGAHEMMSQLLCEEALKHVKNGLICAGRASDYLYIKSNGLYRLADLRAVGVATEFFGDSRYLYCFTAVDTSSPTKVCGWVFTDAYHIYQYDHTTGQALFSYDNSISDFNRCTQAN